MLLLNPAWMQSFGVNGYMEVFGCDLSNYWQEGLVCGKLECRLLDMNGVGVCWAPTNFP